MRSSLPAPLAADIEARTAAWDLARGTERLWRRDAALWTGREEGKWLGWLDVVTRQLASFHRLFALRREATRSDLSHVAVLGMGGSSLCPYVLARSFGPQSGWPSLVVLDSTDPGQIAALEASLDLERTLFVVSSKSGSTLEPNILRDYFLARAPRADRFIAVTDPGSQLEQHSRAAGFRDVLYGDPTIGGRFSALSAFGLVPAALMGLDVELLLARAAGAMERCGPAAKAAGNPGVQLGLAMGAAALRGMDKLTIVATPAIADVGAWLEQLVAESTGKLGKAVIPVDGEDLAGPEVYGEDRLFVYLRLDPFADEGQDAAVAALERAGKPVLRLTLRDRYDLGAQFFLWEFATAVAGAVLGINPFDQPDVEASKEATRRLMSQVESSGSLPAESLPGPGPELAEALRAHLGRLGAGDYFALQAYLPMGARSSAALQRIRHRVRDARGVATTLGFGPRFLHSTGQAHKGGPNSGVFLQITADPARDLPVPGRGYTFGLVEAAQARGDYAVLAQRGRRVLRVHLGADLPAQLAALDAATLQALA
jgi:transaldolase/glucose-6-phosphate isomerase